ncbi:baseplate J/gp47 family protein [Arthrobacter pascens]|uniref:baseplate J/gp47 family protein n=1 Tax=Arthrobacter pascens TaxID=1677 RepID=UPI00196A8319|nr:baseplate J/gp47 family protein [Arthrobacter pascens]MBN3496376.1 baseplate J/gp47 family protein [Arthrobacter pascens]
MTGEAGCGCGTGTTCGCDEATPAVQLPGDPAAFAHHAILERMLDHVAHAEVDAHRPLLGWTTRALDDPGIALLSAQAGAAHVIAWNLHRQHADTTLTRSGDAEALQLLTRLLGHRRRPALAATTVLSFAVSEIDGAPTRATVPAGTKVSTIPEPGEKPQVFETDADLDACRAWNSLSPVRAPQPQTVATTTTSLLVTGVGHAVRTGDHVLTWQGEAGSQTTWVLFRVNAVATDDDAQVPTTTLIVSGGRTCAADSYVTSGAAQGTVVLLGDRAMPFGATAPDISFMPESVRIAKGSPATAAATAWKDFTAFKDTKVDLDTVHAAAAAGRVALLDGSSSVLTRITAAVDTARSDFGLSARCTRLTLARTSAGGIDLAVSPLKELDSEVRTLSIYLETGRLSLVVPLADPELPVTGTAPAQHPALPATAQADRFYVLGTHELPPGRRVVLSGVDTTTGAVATEPAVVAKATAVTGSGVTATLLQLEGTLQRRFRASTLSVLANCTVASQAESAPPIPAAPGVEPGVEILGSGDPGVALPRYPLRRPRLAYLPAAGPAGFAPAIQVSVDGRAFHLVDTLPGDNPTSRDFRVLARGDDSAEVQFGGRLPSGIGNVTARYRTGGGAAGNLVAGRLVQSLTPVTGVSTVTNPVPAEGGSDAETDAEMRETAPRAIRTLGRAVALSDFAAFAEGYRGVGRADATEIRLNRARTIVVTIATTTFAPPAPGSDLITELGDAILAAAPPGTKVLVAGFIDLAMSVGVAFAHDPTYRRPDVEDRVRAALLAQFGAAGRPFARAVHRSEILAFVQNVEGVVAARLVSFSATGVVEDAQGRLPCPGPEAPSTGFMPARRLSLAAAGILPFQELTP